MIYDYLVPDLQQGKPTFSHINYIEMKAVLLYESTVHTRRYVARVDKSHPLIVLSFQFSVNDPLISRMVDSLAAEVSPSLITDITFSQVIEISTRK